MEGRREHGGQRMKVLEEMEGGNREDTERREREGPPEGLLTGGRGNVGLLSVIDVMYLLCFYYDKFV